MSERRRLLCCKIIALLSYVALQLDVLLFLYKRNYLFYFSGKAIIFFVINNKQKDGAFR